MYSPTGRLGEGFSFASGSITHVCLGECLCVDVWISPETR